ncbi:MAG TPA: hypothetical protein VF862_10825, partial [Gemmatimonadales bacterium]
GAEAGFEKFSVIPIAGGTRIVSDVTFTASRPPLEFSLSLERSSPADFAFQFRRSASPSAQFFAILRKDRLTLRRIEVGTEEANESRGTPDLVPLADSMVAPLLQLIPAEGEPERTLTAVYPQGGRRVRIVATRSGGGGGSRITLSGGLEGVLELAPDGTLLRVALPGFKLEAERQAP